MKKPLSRRHLLRGAGGVALGLPFLTCMTGRAKAAAPAKRFLAFFSANGCVHSRWLPQVTNNELVLSESLQPLETFKDRIVAFDKLHMHSATNKTVGGNGHDVGMGHMLTSTDLVAGPGGQGEFGVLVDGSAGGISIDQHIANKIGTDTLYRSLEFGVAASPSFTQPLASYMSYRGQFQPAAPRNNPAAAFDEIFGDMDEGKARRQREMRMSVLDLVLDDYKGLVNKVGAEDRQRLDAHFTALRSIETRLKETEAALDGCQTPVRGIGSDFGDRGDLQMELLVRALACDISRVGSIQWSLAQSGITHTWLGQSVFHHQLSHDGMTSEAARDQLVAIHAWYAEKFNVLLGKLDDVKEGEQGESTLLDNTIVLWCNELGNPWEHRYENVPYVLAGGGGGTLQGGRVVDANGASHGDLFVSIMNKLDIPDQTFGDPQFISGPIAGL